MMLIERIVYATAQLDDSLVCCVNPSSRFPQEPNSPTSRQGLALRRLGDEDCHDRNGMISIDVYNVLNISYVDDLVHMYMYICMHDTCVYIRMLDLYSNHVYVYGKCVYIYIHTMSSSFCQCVARSNKLYLFMCVHTDHYISAMISMVVYVYIYVL